MGPLYAKNVSSGSFREITVGDRSLLQTSSNGNPHYFDADTGIRAFGDIQNITGTEGGSYQRFVGLGDRAPIILENPSTLELLEGVATTAAGFKAIQGGVKAASIFAAEESFERYTGLPSFNPLSLLSGRRVNTLLPGSGVTYVQPPVATSRAGTNFISSNHLTAAAGESDLYRQISQQSNERVIFTHQTVTQNGSDLATYNTQTGYVTLFDNKATIGRRPKIDGTRSPLKITPSDTFTIASRQRKALEQIQRSTPFRNLSDAEQTQVVEAITEARVRLVTRGSGNAKNSVIQYGPNGN